MPSSVWPSLRQIDDDTQRYLNRKRELLLTCEILVRFAWCCKRAQVSCQCGDMGACWQVRWNDEPPAHSLKGNTTMILDAGCQLRAHSTILELHSQKLAAAVSAAAAHPAADGQLVIVLPGVSRLEATLLLQVSSCLAMLSKACCSHIICS